MNKAVITYFNVTQHLAEKKDREIIKVSISKAHFDQAMSRMGARRVTAMLICSYCCLLFFKL
jgi:hypothetical protein